MFNYIHIISPKHGSSPLFHLKGRAATSGQEGIFSSEILSLIYKGCRPQFLENFQVSYSVTYPYQKN